jgi:uncharacterized membrane protein YkoI
MLSPASILAGVLALLAPLGVSADQGPDTPDAVTVQSASHTVAADSADASETISKERSLEIAVEHAGITADQITHIDDHELDADDGRQIWEIEFHADGYEHEFDVDARTGEVIDHERDREDDDVARRGQAPAQPAPSDRLSGEQALQIAVEHTGVGAPSHVDDLELDSDDGRQIWEIEFDAGGLEYEYDVDAHTGAILDVEIDD